jgi:hypothetical protein
MHSIHTDKRIFFISITFANSFFNNVDKARLFYHELLSVLDIKPWLQAGFEVEYTATYTSADTYCELMASRMLAMSNVFLKEISDCLLVLNFIL